MANPFDRFDNSQASGNPFDQFDKHDQTKQKMQEYAESAVKQTIKNIPGSAKQFGKDIFALVAHPKASAEALGKMAAGGAEAAFAAKGETNPRIEQFETAKEFFKQRYGGLGNIKNTIVTDPVGSLADAASLIMAGGGALKLASTGTRLPALERLGAGMTRAGASLDPIALTARGIGKVGRIIPASVPRKMYESAAKFSTVLNDAERVQLTNTALKHGLPPTVKGVMKTSEMIDSLNTKISSLVDQYNNRALVGAITGNPKYRMMPVDELFKDFDALRSNALANSSRPMDEVRAINRIEKQIRQANQQIRRNALSPKEAQMLKQNIYKDMEKYYSKFKNSPASAEAQQAIARSAKEYLEDVIPEIKQLNADEGSLIELRDAIQRSANRISNRDILGIGVPLKGTTGGVVGGAPGAAAGVIIGVLDTPAVKSKLAILLEKMRTKNIIVKPGATAARLGFFNLGRTARGSGMQTEPLSKIWKQKIKQVGNISDRNLSNYFKNE